MSTWLVALAAGAIGNVLTAVIGLGACLLAARREIEATDRFVADRDEELASWVSDRSLALERELTAKTEEMNKENLFYSGAHGTPSPCSRSARCTNTATRSGKRGGTWPSRKSVRRGCIPSGVADAGSRS